MQTQWHDYEAVFPFDSGDIKICLYSNELRHGRAVIAMLRLG